MRVIATVPVLPRAAVNFLISGNSFQNGVYAAFRGRNIKLQRRPRRLADVGTIDMKVEILGANYDSPIGEGVLMDASDSPDSECQFPNSVADILVWPSLSDDTRKQLSCDNANRFFRQT